MSNEHNQKSNRTIFLLIIVIIVAILAIILWPRSNEEHNDTTVEPQEKTFVMQNAYVIFSDGLNNPTTINRFEPDEFGTGITETAEYTYDINQDGRPDKIIRSRKETGTVHFQYIYKILLNEENKFVDITPKDFFTIEGTECALQKIQFSFDPDFSVIKISRPLGDDWYTPTRSVKTTYSLWSNKMHTVNSMVYKTVCDVSELF